jgi:hypothetical protein
MLSSPAPRGPLEKAENLGRAGANTPAIREAGGSIRWAGRRHERLSGGRIVMDPEPPSDDAPAEPIAAKSLGTFNVIFGILFILAVVYEAGVILAMAAIGRLIEWGQQQQGRQGDSRWKAQQERFAERLEEAETDEERELIEAERTIAELGQIRDPEWFGVSLGFVDDPMLRRSTVAKAGILTVLNGLLIASGFGLMRLRRWGRSLAMVAAGLAIPAALGFTVVSVMLTPGMAERWTEELREGVFERTIAGGGEEAAVIEAELATYERSIGRVMAWSTAGANAFGVIYPIVVLVVASREGVRRAVGAGDGR